MSFKGIFFLIMGNFQIKKTGNFKKKLTNSYYTVLLPSGDKRWGNRTIIIATEYKSHKKQPHFYYHIEPSMTNDSILYAKIPKKAGRFLLNYKQDYLKYLRGTSYGQDYIMLGFNIENLPLLANLFKLRNRKHISPEHLKKLHTGRDIYNKSRHPHLTA